MASVICNWTLTDRESKQRDQTAGCCSSLWNRGRFGRYLKELTGLWQTGSEYERKWGRYEGRNQEWLQGFVISITEMRKNKFREKARVLFLIWLLDINQAVRYRLLVFGGRGVGCRYKFESYLPIKTFKGMRLDAMEGVSVDREET